MVWETCLKQEKMEKKNFDKELFQEHIREVFTEEVATKSLNNIEKKLSENKFDSFRLSGSCRNV